MNLQRFLLWSLIVFLLGLAVLYTGANRAPFRQSSPGHGQHQSSLSNGATVLDNGKATTPASRTDFAKA
ncbi:MAG TPA: hypothetical protein VN462_05525 [Negativicutes bacterium]|nr:hypothetical protein [Negativicutes bacterium]